ncbi:hypothetical protein VPHD249_0213 [Vibrio phage D249]
MNNNAILERLMNYLTSIFQIVKERCFCVS